LTIAAWLVLYFSPAVSLLVLIFGFMVALYYFAEALKSQYDLTVGAILYAIPLMVIVAFVATGLFLLVLALLTRGGSPASQYFDSGGS
jgi:hypothetical protein